MFGDRARPRHVHARAVALNKMSAEARNSADVHALAYDLSVEDHAEDEAGGEADQQIFAAVVAHPAIAARRRS